MSDFNTHDTTYTLNASYSTVCINIEAVADDFAEDDETFFVSLSFSNPLDSASDLGAIDVLIIDDEGEN